MVTAIYDLITTCSSAAFRFSRARGGRLTSRRPSALVFCTFEVYNSTYLSSVFRFAHVFSLSLRSASVVPRRAVWGRGARSGSVYTAVGFLSNVNVTKTGKLDRRRPAPGTTARVRVAVGDVRDQRSKVGCTARAVCFTFYAFTNHAAAGFQRHGGAWTRHRQRAECRDERRRGTNSKRNDFTAPPRTEPPHLLMRLLRESIEQPPAATPSAGPCY